MGHARIAIFAALGTFAALASCGDNHSAQDAPPIPDTPTEIPDPPLLGMQADRMGRPLIIGALVGAFRDTPQATDMKRELYNGFPEPPFWATASLGDRTVSAELMTNLGILDVLDQGNMSIPGTGMNIPGCRNQILYNGNISGGGTPGPGSYSMFATLLADDMLFVDTSKPTCTEYFALEAERVSGGAILHSQCGGRAPTHDVVDYTYSALLSGLNGFTPPPAFQPRITDGAARHGDLSDTVFPYFGPPR
jgi:hypothetical protein